MSGPWQPPSAKTAASRVVAAILAGGEGTRLGGVAKGSLLVDGQSILERQIAVLRPLVNRVVLVTGAGPRSTDVPETLHVVKDRHPGAGPLAGLDAAFASLSPEEDWLLCISADLPHLQPSLLRLLRDHDPNPALIPVTPDGRPQPLCARYHRDVAPLVAAALVLGHRRTSEVTTTLPGALLLPASAWQASDPSGLSFFNVNTPEDLAAAQGLGAPSQDV